MGETTDNAGTLCPKMRESGKSFIFREKTKGIKWE
jgi:hypothetical protein